VDTLLERLGLIREAIGRAMKEGIHYGAIPGVAGDKKVLLKPGAETLGLLLRLRPRFKITRTDMGGDHREYEVVCDLYAQDGTHEGQGVGSCSTMESNYRWRQANRVCPQCGAEAIIKGKADWGGGWICWKKKDGCGAKFAGGPGELLEHLPQDRQEACHD